jgi:hypothetical protein
VTAPQFRKGPEKSERRQDIEALAKGAWLKVSTDTADEGRVRSLVSYMHRARGERRRWQVRKDTNGHVWVRRMQ